MGAAATWSFSGRRMLAQCRRRKRVDGAQLWHSEWTRRLGFCSLAAIALTMTVSLTFYVVLPRVFADFFARNHLAEVTEARRHVPNDGATLPSRLPQALRHPHRHYRYRHYRPRGADVNSGRAARFRTSVSALPPHDAKRMDGGDVVRSTPTTPAPLVALSLALFAMFLGGNQLSWMARRLPRNCLLYHFAYATQSQGAAFAVAWTQFADGVALIAALAHVYADHFNLLFTNVVETGHYGTAEARPDLSAVFGSFGNNVSRVGLLFPTTTLPRFPQPSSLSERLAANSTYSDDSVSDGPSMGGVDPSADVVDWFRVALIVLAAAIMMCSLRVLLTITIIFLVATLFTSTSTTIVALLHNLAHVRVDYFNFVATQTTASVRINGSAAGDYSTTATVAGCLLDEVLNAFPYHIVGFLALESVAHCAEETEEPRRTLPTVFRFTCRASAGIAAGAFIAFFPFVFRVAHFDERTQIPALFNTIGIFSARLTLFRYLMNVGAICGLSAALLCAFLAPTRVFCALAADAFLLPRRVAALSGGRAGTPRSATLIVAVCAIGSIVFLPRRRLLDLVPMHVCGRLIFGAYAVYREQFAAEPRLTDVADQPRYCALRRRRHLRHHRRRRRQSNALKRKRPFLVESTNAPQCPREGEIVPDICKGLNESSGDAETSDNESDDLTCSSCDSETETDDEDDCLGGATPRRRGGGSPELHLLERIWRLANGDPAATGVTPTSATGLLERFTQAPVAHRNGLTTYSAFAAANGQAPLCVNGAIVPRLHNCIRSPCGSNFQISAAGTEKRVAHFHVYDASAIGGPRKALVAVGSEGRWRPTERFADAEAVERTARRQLAAFLALGAFVALARRILCRTMEFVPLLALLTLLVSLTAQLRIIHLTFHRMRVSESNTAARLYAVAGANGGVEAVAAEARGDRWRAVGCLASIFLVEQVVFQFPLDNFLRMGVFLAIGVIIYVIRVGGPRTRQKHHLATARSTSNIS